MLILQITPGNFFIKTVFLVTVIDQLTTQLIMESDSELVGENFYFCYWFFTLFFWPALNLKARK